MSNTPVTKEEDLVLRLIGLEEYFSSVSINLDYFVTLLRSEEYWKKYDVNFDPTIDRETLRTGHYATFNKMKIFVKKDVKPGEIVPNG